MHHVASVDLALTPVNDARTVRVLIHNGAALMPIVTTPAKLSLLLPFHALRTTEIVATRWILKTRKSAPVPLTEDNVGVRAAYTTEWRYYNEFDAAEEFRIVYRKSDNAAERSGRRARLRRRRELLEQRICATYCLDAGSHLSFVVYQALRASEVALYSSREWLAALETEARPLNPRIADMAERLRRI